MFADSMVLSKFLIKLSRKGTLSFHMCRNTLANRRVHAYLDPFIPVHASDAHRDAVHQFSLYNQRPFQQNNTRRTYKYSPHLNGRYGMGFTWERSSRHGSTRG